MDLNALFRPKNVGFALILLLFAAFPKVLTLQETFFYRDFSRFAYPLAFTIGRPFGDVSSPCGIHTIIAEFPFLAQWNTKALYPLSFIYLLFPPSGSLGVF